LVVQLPPKQQVVQVTMRPPDVMVCVEQLAQTIDATVASQIPMSAFFMFVSYLELKGNVIRIIFG
jgi:hypothetical protein